MRPLHCVPLAVKDSINTVDLLTTGGSVVFKDVVPIRNMTVIKRLLDAGALLVGKANLDELAIAGSTLSSPSPPRSQPISLSCADLLPNRQRVSFLMMSLSGLLPFFCLLTASREAKPILSVRRPYEKYDFKAN